jgi:hypothetical protein
VFEGIESNPGVYNILIAQIDLPAGFEFVQGSTYTFRNPTPVSKVWTINSQNGTLIAPGNAILSNETAPLGGGATYRDFSIELPTPDESNEKRWTFSNDGALTFPDSTVQTTAWTGSVNSLVNGVHTATLDNYGHLVLSQGNIEGTTGVGIWANDPAQPDYPVVWAFDNIEEGTGNPTHRKGIIQLPFLQLIESWHNNIRLTNPGLSSITMSGDVVIRAKQQADGDYKTWGFGTDGTLTLPGGSAIGYTPSVSTDITVNNKKWAFDVNGTLTVPGNISAEVGKNLSIKTKSVTDIAIEFAGSGYPSLGGLFATTGGSGTGMTVQVYGPSGSLEAVSIGNPGSGYLDGDVVDVVGGNGTVRVRITQGNWTFGTDGGLTFLDNTVQTTAYPGITNTHENSNTIAVGDNIAVRDHLAVRVTNNNDTLDVEIKYSNPDVQAVISVFTMYPVAANLYTGRTVKSANNTTWDLVGNFPMAGDSLGFTLTDHSFFKIYKVTLVAHMMPGVEAAGEALCVIEELK